MSKSLSFATRPASVVVTLVVSDGNEPRGTVKVLLVAQQRYAGVSAVQSSRSADGRISVANARTPACAQMADGGAR